MDPPADAHSPTSIRRSAPDTHGLILVRPLSSWRTSGSRAEFRPGMNWTDPPPKPTLYLNGTKDAHRAKGLLEQYAIDFEERHHPSRSYPSTGTERPIPISLGSQTF
jgi:hypothetical protein